MSACTNHFICTCLREHSLKLERALGAAQDALQSIACFSNPELTEESGWRNSDREELLQTVVIDTNLARDAMEAVVKILGETK